MLLIAVGSLLVDSGTGSAGGASLALVVVFALSNIILFFTPRRVMNSLRFELMVGAADILLVALGIHLAGASRSALAVSCLLMVLVVALSNYRAHSVAGAAVVGALHSWLVLGSDSNVAITWQLVLQVLFLCSVALYYGFLAQGIHRTFRKEEAEQLKRSELKILLEILEEVTSSLDLGQVSRTITNKVTEIVPSVRCSMLFIDESETRCYVMASHDDPDLEMLEIDLAKYPEVRRAIKTRDPVLVQDVANDPIMAEVRTVLKGLNFNSVIVIPMVFGGDVLGTLCLKTIRSGEGFQESEVDFCKAVARAAAAALKNAMLHRDVTLELGRHCQTAEKLSSVLDNSPDIILTTDNKGCITEFNHGAEKLTGFSRGEVLGRPCGTLLNESGSERLVERIRAEGGIYNYSCSFGKKDGSELSLEFNMAALEDEGAESRGTVWIGRDVTALKSTQLQLLQAKKLSTIGEVISGVAHELNNPLSGVLGYSQLLLARHSGGSMTRGLERIHESAIRCQKIVKNLLSFARAHKPERKYLGVNGILLKTLELRKYQLQANDVEVACELDPELPCTMLDFHQMQQVFLNLVNNADHAMATVRDRPGRLLVRTALEGGKIQVEIQDNGGGMDQETLERVFDPFFTTKEQGRGTGLGLSVSYGIVKEHGGRVFARSCKGKGTSFFIELPVRKDEERQSNALTTPSKIAVPTRAKDENHILVVDDEPAILDLLVDILEDCGHRVDTASNGAEARRKIRAQGYDVVITDIRMPQMNGMQLYREILAARPEMGRRIIFITGDVIDEETVEFLASINAKGIAKPLDISEMLKAVEETLKGQEESVPA